MAYEFSSNLIDENETDSNVTKGLTDYRTMLYEDIVRGLTTEKQHEIWNRVHKMGWSYSETAEFFECTTENIKRTLSDIKSKVKNFRVNVRQRGGYIFK